MTDKETIKMIKELFLGLNLNKDDYSELLNFLQRVYNKKYNSEDSEPEDSEPEDSEVKAENMPAVICSYEFDRDDYNWDAEDRTEEDEKFMEKLKTKNKDLYEKTNYVIVNTGYVSRLLSPTIENTRENESYLRHMLFPNIIGVDVREDFERKYCNNPKSYFKSGTKAKYILDKFLSKTHGCILFDCRNSSISEVIKELDDLEFCGGLNSYTDIDWYKLDDDVIAIIRYDTESG